MRFAAVGLNHDHISGQTRMLLAAGAELASYYAPEAELAAVFAASFPGVPRARSLDEVLDDASIQIVASAAIPDQRAELAIAAMRHGKDVLMDKPGCTTLDQLDALRRVQRETGRHFVIFFGEHVASRATVRAGELVAAGAIGRVVQTVGLGPHRANLARRPAWFFRRQQYGGILTDIASHQVEQFLFFTGSERAEVASSHVGNFAHPEHPELEDYGDMLLRGDGGLGSIRVDWYTPDGLPSWGDGRLFVLGTDGFIEVRKSCDLAGREGGDHVFLVDQHGTQYIDCRSAPLPFGSLFLADVRERTEQALPQARCFLAMQLALEAEARAVRLGALVSPSP